MAIIVDTIDPHRLVRLIRAAIDDGSVAAWSYDSDGDLCLVSPAFQNEAWMRPNPSGDRLVFNIIGHRGKRMPANAYAHLHALLIQMLLAQFDRYFSDVRATAMPTPRDWVGPPTDE